MATLDQLLPDVEVALALPPEELAVFVFEVAKSQMQNGAVHSDNIVIVHQALGPGSGTQSPYILKERQVQQAVSEAWNWLRVQGLFVPQPGMNGSNGWCILSRKGAAIKDREGFDKLRAASTFPKQLLHPAIADKVWLDLMRGDLADAVFVAFRTVEEAVRNAGGYRANEIGVPLMRKAFDVKSGPLTDKDQESSEREALAHLFAAAIGSYKNPHSHRTVTISDTKEAQEMVVLLPICCAS